MLILFAARTQFNLLTFDERHFAILLLSRQSILLVPFAVVVVVLSLCLLFAIHLICHVVCAVNCLFVFY